jgi:class 3 adenylate cyclase
MTVNVTTSVRDIAAARGIEIQREELWSPLPEPLLDAVFGAEPAFPNVRLFAASGLGRTRMLGALGALAREAGLVVIRAGVHSHFEPGGLAHQTDLLLAILREARRRTDVEADGPGFQRGEGGDVVSVVEARRRLLGLGSLEDLKEGLRRQMEHILQRNGGRGPIVILLQWEWENLNPEVPRDPLLPLLDAVGRLQEEGFPVRTAMASHLLIEAHWANSSPIFDERAIPVELLPLDPVASLEGVVRRLGLEGIDPRKEEQLARDVYLTTFGAPIHLERLVRHARALAASGRVTRDTLAKAVAETRSDLLYNTFGDLVGKLRPPALKVLSALGETWERRAPVAGYRSRWPFVRGRQGPGREQRPQIPGRLSWAELEERLELSPEKIREIVFGLEGNQLVVRGGILVQEMTPGLSHVARTLQRSSGMA